MPHDFSINVVYNLFQQVKSIVGDLLDSKASQWAEYRTLCASRLRELAEYFTGNKALARVKKDERMMQWFASLATEVSCLVKGIMVVLAVLIILIGGGIICLNTIHHLFLQLFYPSL